ncbi:MAG: sulfotransferase [Balneolaceae bacterium]
MKCHVIVIGLTRSGTTFVTNILAKSGQFKVEVEPHALWKSGNYKYLNDEEYDVNEKTVAKIKKTLCGHLEGKRLLEKSPINSLRPYLVHKVFPDAKIVYIERDPIRCIYSNYERSLKNDSFKPSITLRKYFFKTGYEDLPFATSNRKLFSQLTWEDLPYFTKYVCYMVWQRSIKPSLFPFGPKLKNFMSYIEKNGFLKYHVEVFVRSLHFKAVFESLYQDRLKTFRLEKLMTDRNELVQLFEWAGLEVNEKDLRKVLSNIDEGRKKKSTKKRDVDYRIEELLTESLSYYENAKYKNGN